jgi:hypothetical protein
MKEKSHNIGDLVVRLFNNRPFWKMVGVITEVNWSEMRQTFYHKVAWFDPQLVSHTSWKHEELKLIHEVNDEER